MFINTALLSEEDNKVVTEIAEQNNVTAIPSILIFDSKGQYHTLIEGEFQDSNVIDILDKLTAR